MGACGASWNDGFRKHNDPDAFMLERDLHGPPLPTQVAPAQGHPAANTRMT